MHDLADIFERENVKEAVNKLKGIIERLNLSIPHINSNVELDELVNSVNQERLKNNPIKLEKENIIEIYSESLRGNRK